MKFRSVLVANRGEIALRVMRTARRLGLRTVAVWSEADRDAPHVRFADAAERIGGTAPRDSYLNIDALVGAARRSGAEAVHPGYGFLSESADFARAVEAAGLVWIGPPAAAVEAMGDKANAKRTAAQAGALVLPSYEGEPEYPVMIKAVAGGGGRGIRLVRSAVELAAALKTAQSEAGHAFGDGRVILEKALISPRHVEVQVFADRHGHCIHLGERDCSVQRRHQKLVEESPSPAVDVALRARMGEAAVRVARAMDYVGAGTVEFLLGDDRRFWFMEMNTRLQVEHPVTEALTGLDLVEWQLRIADGEPLPLRQEDVRLEGHAIEVRLCAEDPARDFLPQSGTLRLWRPADGVRVDHALESGATIPPEYDSMMAKLVAHASTRDAAREKLALALDETVALGLPTNKAFLAAVLRDPEFAAGRATTAFLAGRPFVEPHVEDAVLDEAARLLAGDHGEWSGWSNNCLHGGRVRFGDRVVAVDFRKPVLPPRAHVADGDAIHLASGGASVSLRNTLYDPPAKRGADAGDGRLAAPMNGRVAAVEVAVGDVVSAGKVLVVLEAMKMEHGLSVGTTVRVTAVHASAGMQVAPGRLLVEFEPA